MTVWMPEALRRNADTLLSVMPLTAAVLAAMQGGLPSWLGRFATSIVQFPRRMPEAAGGWTLLVRRARRAGPDPVFSRLAPCPSLIVAAFLLGSYGATPAEPARPPVTYVFSSNSMLRILPIHPAGAFRECGGHREVETDAGIRTTSGWRRGGGSGNPCSR